MLVVCPSITNFSGLKIKTYPSPFARSIFNIYNFQTENALCLSYKISILIRRFVDLIFRLRARGRACGRNPNQLSFHRNRERVI